MKWQGPDALRPFLIEIGSVTQDPDNARKHDETNRSVLRELLLAHGQMQVLTSYAGVLLTGNARHGEMLKLEWTHVAVVDLSKHFPTKEQARAYAIADNRTGELADWDTERLGKALTALPESCKPQTGFSPSQWNIKPAADWAKGPTQVSKEHTFLLTADQFRILDRAVEKLRADHNDPTIKRGQCLQLIAQAFIVEQQPEQA